MPIAILFENPGNPYAQFVWRDWSVKASEKGDAMLLPPSWWRIDLDTKLSEQSAMRYSERLITVNASGLIEKLSSENFEPENYDDEYRNRVLAMIDQKTKGTRDHDRTARTGVRASH